jgi:hypothetical protein
MKQLYLCGVNGDVANQLRGWHNFTVGLVNRRYDFEELQLPNIATQDNSLRLFCNTLMDGIENGDPNQMPFYCEQNSASWHWYKYLLNLAKQERTRRHKEHPISLSWVFYIDRQCQRIRASVIAKFPNTISEEFIQQQNLNPNGESLTLNLKINGDLKVSFIYFRRFCRNANNCIFNCRPGDLVSISTDDNVPILAEQLDLSTPHVLYQMPDNSFILGNRIGELNSCIIFSDTEGWGLENNDLVRESLTWHGSEIEQENFSFIFIQSNYTQDIILTRDGIPYQFNNKTRYKWTEINIPNIASEYFDEPIYNLSDTQNNFCLCEDDEKSVVNDNEIEFRDFGKDLSWHQQASFGRIRARVISPDCLVTPLTLINVGANFNISCIRADEHTCIMHFEWDEGDIIPESGNKIERNWSFSREDTLRNSVKVRFIPNGNQDNYFWLTIKLPFKAFSITDAFGNDINNGDSIPISAFERYSYHIVGYERIHFTFGGFHREITNENFGLSLNYRDINNENVRRRINFEGKLYNLFDSISKIKMLIDQTAQNILDRSVTIYFSQDNRRFFSFTVKDFPYRLGQDKENGRINVFQNEIPIDYHGMLRYSYIEDPDALSHEIQYDENHQGFFLPDGIEQGAQLIVYGETPGIILPTLFIVGEIIDREERQRKLEEATNQINLSLNEHDYSDPYWMRAEKWLKKASIEGVPYSSILELRLLNEKPQGLIAFAFKLYIDSKNDEEKEKNIAEYLIALSDDLCFQWYWLINYLNEIGAVIYYYINNNDKIIDSCYFKYFLKTIGPETTPVPRENEEQWYPALIEQFKQWLIGSITDAASWGPVMLSFTDSYNSASFSELETDSIKGIISPDDRVRIEQIDEYQFNYNQNNEDVDALFQEINIEDNNAAPNKREFLKRVKAVSDHIRGYINIFKKDYQMRMSIIYYFRIYREQFLIELNNELM